MSAYMIGLWAAWACVIAAVVCGGVRDVWRKIAAGQVSSRNGEIYYRWTNPGWFWLHVLQSAALWLLALVLVVALAVGTVHVFSTIP